MPADARIDPKVEAAGGIHWFATHGPLAPIGPCPHDCRHSYTANIAWGYDMDHYTLDECRDSEGCAGRCRGWTAVHPNGRTRLFHGVQQVKTEAAP